MKNIVFVIIFALTLFVAGDRTANAQEKRLDSAPQSFRTFFAKFKSAVEKNDKTAIAALTRFPFSYGFDAGDEGTMTKAQFVKRFNEIFGKSPKRFFKKKNPLFSKSDGGSYVVSTEDAAHLIFVSDKSGFKFTAYMVEP